MKPFIATDILPDLPTAQKVAVLLWETQWDHEKRWPPTPSIPRDDVEKESEKCGTSRS